MARADPQLVDMLEVFEIFVLCERVKICVLFPAPPPKKNYLTNDEIVPPYGLKKTNQIMYSGICSGRPDLRKAQLCRLILDHTD